MRNLLLIFTLAAVPGLVQANMSWRAVPEIAVQETQGGGHRHEGPRTYYLRDGEGAETIVRTPDLQTRPLAIKDGVRAELMPTGKDGYHMLLARRELAGEVRAAVRYLYLPGKPTGNSPSEQLQDPLTRLELIPDPLPREHWRYESGEGSAFRVQFDREPLANTPVRLITSNGTFLEENTDARGMVSFQLPEDFSRIGAGRSANRPAEFVAEVAHRVDNTRFVTTVNADYHVNPRHWQSTFAGGAILAAGFLVGLVAVRPRKEQA